MISLHILSIEFLKRALVGVLFAGCTLSILMYAHPFYVTFYTTILMSIILCIEWPAIASRTHLWLLTPLYPILPALLIILTPQPALLLIICIGFTFDTCAYLSGKLYGRMPLCPSISKNKTIEGCIGGLCGVMLIFYVLMLTSSLSSIFIKSILFSIAAITGDLFESWLKRRANIKDAGYLLPGHGGLLDRFDSIFFILIMHYLLKLFSA